MTQERLSPKSEQELQLEAETDVFARDVEAVVRAYDPEVLRMAVKILSRLPYLKYAEGGITGESLRAQIQREYEVERGR